jgi:peroxiredoxin
LVVIGIHSESDGDKCGDFVREQKFTFPIAVDTGATAEHYGISGIPAYFLIDRAGKVAEITEGGVPKETAVEKLLSAQTRELMTSKLCV